MMLLSMLCILLLVVLDQLSKYWTLMVLQPVGSMPFIPGVLQLRFVLNDGAAFSMFAGKQTMLIIVTSIFMLIMLVMLLTKWLPNAWCHWGLVLIVGGGIGNLIDRVLNGAVVDMFEVLFMEFAVFNVADCFVTVGCVLLFIGILFSEKIEAAQKKKAAADSKAAQQPTQEPGHDS